MASSLNIITTNDELLRRVVAPAREYFDRIVVVNGNPRDVKTIDFLERLDVEVINREWDDDFGAAYQAHLDEMNVGDTVLILDSDEIPSTKLLEGVKHLSDTNWEGVDEDMILLPNVLHIDEVPVERRTQIPEVYKEGMFTKPILFRYNNNQMNVQGAHVSVLGSKYGYRPWPYYHMKSAKSFVTNDILHMFLKPTNQGLTEDEAARLMSLYKRLGITSGIGAVNYLSGITSENMVIDPEMKELIDEWAHDDGSPKSRLAWWYYMNVPALWRPDHVKSREDIELHFQRNWIDCKL